MNLKSLIIILSLFIVGCSSTQVERKILNSARRERIFGKVWSNSIFRRNFKNS